jgi:tetratricopeptide (TPR) repeat protein
MLGDCYLRLNERTRASVEYRRVIAIVDQALDINPRDGASLSLRAVAEVRLGTTNAAVRDAERAVALSPKAADVLYRRAVVLALSGQPAASLSALRTALEQGYSPSLAAKDPDLEELRKRPDFAAIVAGPQPRVASRN